MQPAIVERASAVEVRRSVEEIYELPPLPETARRLLALRRNADASAADLARLVELDPALAAHLVRYAASPQFAYQGKIRSIRDAIARVLGYELAMSVALGLAAGKSLQNPAEGAFGLHAFWRRAVYSAAFSQALARAMPSAIRPAPGLAYLAGLLHDFGFMLLGHLYPPEFALLNKMVAAHPATPITQIERSLLAMGGAQRLLGLGHARVGAWLMESWGMQPELVAALEQHHNPAYSGEHAAYPNLVLLADHLLLRAGLGCGGEAELPLQVLARLQLEEQVMLEVWERTMDGCEGLDAIARELTSC
jgi:HD-like signal output (HDOD) protein